MIEHYIGINLAAGYGEKDLKDLVALLCTGRAIDYAVLMANGPEEAKPDPTREQLGIIGREAAISAALTKKLRASSSNAGHAVSDWTSEIKHGSYFEVLIHYDGEPTGHVARVTVELDRFDRELVDSYQREQGLR